MSRTVLIASAAILLALAGQQLFQSSQLHSLGHIPAETQVAFAAWKREQGRLYGSPEEHLYRLGVFHDTYEHIKKVNAEQDDFELGLNQFSDLTEKEFQMKYTGAGNPEFLQELERMAEEHKKEQEGSEEEEQELEELQTPDYVDWVDKGAYGPAVNQASCGSCWAFAGAALFEGAYFAKHNQKIKISEQYLVNCDTQSNGCNGGSIHKTIYATKGVVRSTELAYTASRGACDYSKFSQFYKIYSMGMKMPSNVNQIRIDLVNAPGYVLVHADKTFASYKSGILTDVQATDAVNHAVVAVGFSTSQNYIRIRNSWGTGWGESGYIRLKLGQSGLGASNVYKYFFSFKLP